MNTNLNIQSAGRKMIPNGNHPDAFPATMNEQPGTIGFADKAGDALIMHDAKIITPQPYGVFALCKIIEHLQNN